MKDMIDIENVVIQAYYHLGCTACVKKLSRV
uniref:Uncharacterized protein n=1 Tax=Arundo donax TaxID=35708 RepID=A0A0A9BSR4_ARUDO